MRLNILFLITFSFSQVASDYLYTTPESAGLAGSNVASEGGEFSLFHNPAGIVQQSTNVLVVGNSELFGFSFLPYQYLGFILSNESESNIGLSYEKSSVSIGKNDLSKEESIGLTRAHFLQKDKNSEFIIGYRLKILNWDLGKSAGISGDGSDGLNLGSASTYGIDLGFQAVLRDKHRFGIELKNINSPTIGMGVTNQYLPRRMVVGISYTPNTNIVTSFALTRSIGLPLLVMGGFEYIYNSIITLRVGAQSNPSRLGLGITINKNNIKLNYAALSHHVMPVTHQFSLGYHF